MRLKLNCCKFSLKTILLITVIICGSEQFQCPDKFGHYPDSGDCSKYYVCDHGKTLEAKCDDGLYYNAHLKTCDWPRNVNCDDNGNRANELTAREVKKHSYNRQKSHPLSPAQQPNQLLPHNNQWNSEPESDQDFDQNFDDQPQIEPDFAPISPSHRPPPPSQSPPKQLIKDSPPVKLDIPEFKANFDPFPSHSPRSQPLPPVRAPASQSAPFSRLSGSQPFSPTPSPSPQPLLPPPKHAEPQHERKPDTIPHNRDYDYEPDYYDYEEPSHDSRKSPKEESAPQNSLESTSKAPHVKRMGWLPHDEDSGDLDQYHWSMDDAVNFAQDKPRIPNEAYVKMRDFKNVEKELEEDEPNEGDPPSDDEYYDSAEDEEHHPPPPPPPKGNGYVKYNYANDRPSKEIRYDDEDESPTLPQPPAREPDRPLAREPDRPPARAPPSLHNNPKSRGPEHQSPYTYTRFDSRENRPPPPPNHSSDSTSGSRYTNTNSKPMPKISSLKPNSNQKISPYLRPIQMSDKYEENNNKPKGKLIKSVPRTNKPSTNTRYDSNQNRPKVVKVQKNVQPVTPSVYQLLDDYRKELPDAILRHKNFAEDFRDSIIDNYMNNNKPNYILNDKDFDDQKSYKIPVVSGEEGDSVRDFDSDVEAINVSIQGKNDKKVSANSNRNSLKANLTEDKPNFRDKAVHRYVNTDVIVKQQRAQDSINSLTTVLPPVSEDNERTSKKPTVSIVIKHDRDRNDYKPPMKRPPQNSFELERPPQNSFELKPYTSITTISPNTSTPKTNKIRIKSFNHSPKVAPKEQVFQDERAKQEKKPKVTERPKESWHSQQTHSYRKAGTCNKDSCTIPNCRCGGTDIPGGLQAKQMPQIVLLTFDDSVNDLNWDIYEDLFNSGRNNPNGCPILGTFYVSHEWTDYAQVQSLYSRGHEMASHSVTHSFGEKFSKDLWFKEIAGQRELLHLYGGVKPEDVRGMRAPFLQTGGNTMFEMLLEANFTYDSSLPVYDINPPYFPYTLDYAINHECMITPCPTKSFPGLWEVGMVMWQDLRGGRCSMADACFNPTSEQGVYEMVRNNFDRHYKTNRAPFGIYFHSRWFLTDHNRKGFIKFLDEIIGMNDVFFVTNWQMIQWMRDPTPLSRINEFKPWKCDFSDRPQECDRPYDCKVKLRSEIRVLKTCQSCPKVYPWRGNNGLKSTP